MKQNNIRLIIILGALAISGIIIIQIYWMQKAWNTNEKQFNQQIHIVLQDVVNRIFKYNKIDPPAEYPVNQISTNYFVVNTNSEIDTEILEYFLNTEMEAHNLIIDYEYAIYSCYNDKMVYGSYVDLDGKTKGNDPSNNFPKYDEYLYYFGIHFPSKKALIFTNMSIWIIFSSIFLFVIIFFSYSLYIILQQKRLSEQQKNFINNMTHEFKTPISSINLSSDVLLDKNILKDPKRLAKYAGLIKQENERLNKQVEKVLNIARLEKRHFNLNLEKFNAHSLIVDLSNSVILNKNSKITCELNAKNSTIKADKLHFTNILLNLFDNAVKYSGLNPRIIVQTNSIKNNLILAIKDKGKGIPKDLQKKVFHKFYRVPTGNVHDVKGFGLGLYYVKSICTLMKWKLSLDSAIDEGTVIKIIIPVID